MRSLIFIFSILLFFGCNTYKETNEFKTKEVIKKEEITAPGFCCKCGFTISLEYECSCSAWRNCVQGYKDVKYLETYRKIDVYNDNKKIRSFYRFEKSQKID